MPLRRLVLISALSIGSPGTLSAQARGGAAEEWRSIEVAGVPRAYLLHHPASRPPGESLPLLLVFHGAGGDAAGMAEHTGLSATATARGYAVVYPEGIRRRWNDGRGRDTGQDDVGFVRQLLDSLARELPVNPRRIYATGISNGAGMAFRLACDLPRTLAAIAPVAGALPATLERRCSGTAPISLVMFHGTEDRLMPYDGGLSGSQRGRVLPAPSTAALFAKVNGCASPPVSTAQPDTVTDGTRVRRSAYTGCREGHEVVLYTVEGGGHTWPGGPPVGRSMGRVSGDLDATRTLLDFFDRRPDPGAGHSRHEPAARP